MSNIVFGNNKPLLSIVIPTRNRFRYAKHAIENVVAINDSRVELIIQDNSDSDELKLWIESKVLKSYIVYNHSKEPLSFVGNFNKAIELCSGEYVCIIGDDDGINPEIVKAVSWLKKNNIDALSLKTSANYVWPDSEIPPTIFTKKTTGNLSLANYQGYIHQSYPQEEIVQFIKGGCLNYLNYDLPKLYHGIVRRKCLDAVKTRSGSYFSGLSPDISIAVSLSFTVSNLFVTDYPLTLPGVCGVSGSVVEGLLKKNSKKLEEAPHLRHRGNYVWSALIPRFYCVETIWGDSSIAALFSIGRSDLVTKFNFIRFCAYCIHKNSESTSFIYNHFVTSIRSSKANFFLPRFRLVFCLVIFKVGVINNIFQRLINRLLILIGFRRPIRFEDLNNIMEASTALSSYFDQRNESFDNYVKNVKISS